MTKPQDTQEMPPYVAAAWADITEQGDPTVLDVLDHIATFAEGWPALLASETYFTLVQEAAVSNEH